MAFRPRLQLGSPVYLEHDDPDDLVDTRPPEVQAAEHAAGQVARLEHQLQHASPTDPTLLARMRRDLALWRRQVEELRRRDLWSDGAGDRRLF